MAQSYLIFDFVANEDFVHQARQRLDGWRQAFRLTNKLEFRFERKAGEKEGSPEQFRVIIRLDFSDHEKLSYQRWLNRIPTEAPFKDASPKVVHAGDAEFAATADLFESLDHSQRAADRASRGR
jgi:hypothetical protein